ncbi:MULTISPECIES: RagB/SusD family nutrient uptake outer membrane protein [unclassified Spirosoma]|uniref:RagB/SusD family nutrient uptake outer membrane protein n=1 Tax=unclassified Spirosoma TaxID=2621999 RepID=UPI00096A1F15|nr:MULTISPECIES: RagB/SusD family nutrient uptake outer membrane protein [unclassified Spirosoma]MBN8824934.1 RagB/SusD family nutrient uptake outer membrane protein [Spirosoma sp.]OJW74747.1 MAG: RagB/SusD family nutrient uptake outer membrane protein [Spirosoma sp. 48-14]
MKTLFSLFALTALLMVSCKSFIEVPPVSTVSVDALYKTDKDYQDAVVAAYNTLQLQYQDFWIFGDMRGDDARQEVVKTDPWYFSDAFILSSDNDLLRTTWRNYYNIINRTNTILTRIESADPAVITNKNRHMAEAKFLRAFAYFDLVRIFGDVPMLTKPATTDEAYKLAREKADRIYDEIIIKDLMDAENALPTKYTGTDVGRATKGAAKAILGRVYMTRKDFVKAEAKLQEVTTLGYSLLPNFNDLFVYTKDEHHSEYIFDIEYEEGIGEGSVFTNRFFPNSAAMADVYGVKGGLTEANSPSPGLIALFTADDRRKDITVQKDVFIDKNGNPVKLPSATSQGYTKKYITPVATGNDSRANWKVIRYADVLLMYAEALNENGKTAQALPFINQVRTRAGVAPYSNLSKDELREKIYQERRLELAFEGVRWFDLVRTGRAFDTLKSLGMKDYMTVFAIPLSQIQLINNRTIFPQNPGYE